MSPVDTPRPLEGRHAVVTGAGQGIGKAIARALAAQGATLTLMGRREQPLQALAAELRAELTAELTAESVADLGGHAVRAQAVVCDVSDAAGVAHAFAQARAAFGPVAILVNNAGQAQTAKLERTPDELWAQMLGVNLSGTFFCTRAALPDMQAAGWGRIVNVASTAAQKGYAYVSAYCAAKHGVLGLTRALALEVAAQGITVNAVCPGYSDTELLRESVERIVQKTGRSPTEALESFSRHNPQGRLIQPMEVAQLVSFLCMDAASGINGQALNVCGGEVQ
jgi:NAD(P)-dependent dehydrogenase (short-subunit alcohol dehydrogenase family)